MMPRLEDLLDRQFKRYHLDRTLLQRFETDEERGKTAAPVVTISREMGSGGATIGKIVANLLHFVLYDREVIEKIATETGSSGDHIAKHETMPRDAVSGLLMNLLDSRHVSDTVYVRSLYRVLRGIADRGNAVIIGRGGPCVLTSSVKVRIVAPFDLRVQRMMAARDLSHKEAEHQTLEADHAQKRFLLGYFGCEANDPLIYDLIINTDKLSLEHAAELIVARVRQAWKEE